MILGSAGVQEHRKRGRRVGAPQAKFGDLEFWNWP